MTVKGQWRDSQIHFWTCADCGKKAYKSRKDARQAMRRWGDTAGWSVYRCGQFWHFGHKPTALRRGLVSQDELRARAEADR